MSYTIPSGGTFPKRLDIPLAESDWIEVKSGDVLFLEQITGQVVFTSTVDTVCKSTGTMAAHDTHAASVTAELKEPLLLAHVTKTEVVLVEVG